MWGSEVLIYGYGAVCLCMMVFHIVYTLVLWRKEPGTERKVEKVKRELMETYKRKPDGSNAQEQDVRLVLKRVRLNLKKTDDLLTLSEVLGEWEREEEQTAEMFLEDLQPVLPSLAKSYLKKDAMQTAYFAVFLQHYRRKSDSDNALLEWLLAYVEKENMYCRINALDALYAIGNVEVVVRALVIQDSRRSFFHERVLTEGLLGFAGDHQVLAEKLLERFDEWSGKTRYAVLNYIRFQSGDYKELMYRILTDEKEDQELRLLAVRYFGRHLWEPAKEILISFARDTDVLRWEYAAVAAASLKEYKGDEVTAALKSALFSSNWYVRYNAALSLEAAGFSYQEMIDVISAKDRYAREMLEYRLEERRLAEANENQEERV